MTLTPPTHRDGSLRKRAPSGALQTSGELLLRKCLGCDQPAVIQPDTGVCAVCQPSTFSWLKRELDRRAARLGSHAEV